MTATIGVGPRSEGGFGITAELDVYLVAPVMQKAFDIAGCKADVR